MAKKERCYKHPVDVPFEAFWLKRNCYNMLYHATLLHIKSLRPNPVLGLNTASKKTRVCMHACMHPGSALRSVQFLQNSMRKHLSS